MPIENRSSHFFDIEILKESSFGEKQNMIEFLDLLVQLIDVENVNIRDAIRSSNRKKLVMSMHRIKSNFRICGFPFLFQMAKDLEANLQDNNTVDVGLINEFTALMQRAKKTAISEKEILSA